jgi:hypothetical protein
MFPTVARTLDCYQVAREQHGIADKYRYAREKNVIRKFFDHISCMDMKHLHLVLRLRTRVTVPPLPMYFHGVVLG